MTIRLRVQDKTDVDSRHGRLYNSAVAPERTIELTNERAIVQTTGNYDGDGITPTTFNYVTGYDVTQDTEATRSVMTRDELIAQVTTTPADSEISLTTRAYRPYEGAGRVNIRLDKSIELEGRGDLPLSETALFVDSAEHQSTYINNILEESVEQRIVRVTIKVVEGSPEFDVLSRIHVGMRAVFDGRRCVIEHESFAIDKASRLVIVYLDLNLESGSGVMVWDSGDTWDSGVVWG